MANSLYKDIIQESPDYIDAYHRLAYLARQRGDYSRALHWVEQATQSRAKAPVNQHCLKGKFLFEMGRYADSSNEFRLVVERIVRDDSYSFVGLANIAF